MQFFKMFSLRRLLTKQTADKLLPCYKINNLSTLYSNPCIVQPSFSVIQHNLQICRFKSKGDKSSGKKLVSDSESEEKDTENDFFDVIQDKNTKILKVNVTSMRLDAVLKAGLGLSRNKIEVLFYDSKIRLNGEKVLKKSVHVKEGDEIDLIKGVNMNNPNFLTVARTEVLSAVGKDESISLKIRRCKSLTIENYKGRNSWES